MSNKGKVGVLFVCMGNICRSPMAHGLFVHMLREQGLLDRVIVDSAGTHAYHVGEPPDRRSQETARRRGVDLSELRARKVEASDFAEYEYVLAMDRDNLFALKHACPPEHSHKLRLFLDFAPGMGTQEVPDPYYGGASGFERVYDLVEAAARGLLEDLRRKHL